MSSDQQLSGSSRIFRSFNQLTGQRFAESYFDKELVRRSVILLCFFMLIESLIKRSSSQDPGLYESNFILGRAVVSNGYAFGQFLLGILFPIVAFKHCAWGRDDFDRLARAATIVGVFCFAWAFSTYDYNFWFERWHTADRLLLLLFALLTIWNPVFIWLFVLQTNLLLGQFEHPLPVTWTDKIPMAECLYLAAAFQLVRRFAPSWDSRPYVFCVLVLWGAFYFVTGLAKLRIGWSLFNDTENILYGAWVQDGWLSFLHADSIKNIAGFVDFTKPVSRLVVMSVELSSILLLLNRRLTATLLVGFAGLHLSIFLLTGICFWKWFLAVGVMAIWVRRIKESDAYTFFCPRHALVAAALVLCYINVSHRPIWLGWYDTRLYGRFEVMAQDDQGREYQVPCAQFAPYDCVFAQGRFYFATEIPRLVSCLGSVDTREESQLIERMVADPVQLREKRSEIGDYIPDPLLREQYLTLIEKRFTAAKKSWLPAWCKAPQHIWTYAYPFLDRPVLPTDHGEITHLDITLTEWIRTDQDDITPLLREPIASMATRTDNASMNR